MTIMEDNPDTIRNGSDPSGTYILEYYQRPLILFHEEHARSTSDFFLPHPIRQRYWQLVSPGEYTDQHARDLLTSYLTSVKSQLGELIGKLSVAYCLHLYRRLSPEPIGRNQQPNTVGITRAILESAIQKYADSQFCTKIAYSSKIPIDKVFAGLLMYPEFEHERNAISQNNQLVFTDFTSSDLTDFYNLEKLAYEIWKTSAVLRATGKGAPLFVHHEGTVSTAGNDTPLIVYHEGEYFFDGRSDELEFLLSSYDDRISNSGFPHTSSGVVYADWTEDSTGCVLLPAYNLFRLPLSDFKDFFSKVYHINFPNDFKPNFLWIPINLKQYRIAHLPFADKFYETHNVTLDSVLALIATLCLRVQYLWAQNVSLLVRYYQRAYGLSKRTSIEEELLYFLPQSCQLLGIVESDVTHSDFISAIDFWTLNNTKRNNIDLSYSGPHYIFLPIQNGEVFIDYAWIRRRLADLFFGINPRNQNFKGEALEKMVNTGKSSLTTNPCKSINGERKQIDYAVSFGSHLIIVECKAVNMSIGFDRGDPQSIGFRTEEVVERALAEVDIKANWLVANPKGSNYDVSNYEDIIPLAISPFTEFIPSRNTHYWLTNDIPRVLNPREFKHFLSNLPKITSVNNTVLLNREC